MSETPTPKLCPNYPARAPHNCAGVAGQVGPDGAVYVCTFCRDAQPTPARPFRDLLWLQEDGLHDPHA